MPVNQISFPNYSINSAVDPSMWNSLGNLGNVYRDAAAAQAKREALSSLGTDPQANLRTLLTSGDPTLAQLGLNLQQKELERAREDERYKVTDARANAQLAIQQAAARRAQQDWQEAERDRIAAGKVIGGMFGGAPTPFPAPLPGQPSPAPSPAAPFPAPVPGPQAQATPPVMAQGGDEPSAFSATPRMPAGFQAPPPDVPPVTPPVVAQQEAPDLPSWASPQSLVGRVAANLVSPNPAAAAGIGRDQLAAMYQNPLTRPLATAFLQKQFDPGTYTFQQVGDKLIRTNSKTGAHDVVMSDTKPTVLGEGQRLIGHDAEGQPIDVTPGGAVSKEQRERDARYADAIKRGYNETTSNYYALNGKLPKEDLTPTEMKAVSEAEKQVTSGSDVLDNLARLKELSPKAWSGWGAGKRAAVANALLPNDILQSFAPGAIDTKELSNLALQNVAGQAKAMFGARLAVAEVKLLNQIETTPEMSDAERQRIYVRIEKLVKRHVDAAQAEAEGIRNKTYFKPGGRAPPAAQGPTWSIEAE